MRLGRLSAKRRPNARNTLPAESASDPLIGSMSNSLSAVSPNAASAERQISPCCPEVTMRTEKSSPLSLSAFTTGASLIASGRVPTIISQRNAGGSFEGLFCIRPPQVSPIAQKSLHHIFDNQISIFGQTFFMVKV